MDSGKKTINHVEIRKILPVQDGTVCQENMSRTGAVF